jgi:carboxyl-terminal processing protease
MKMIQRLLLCFLLLGGSAFAKPQVVPYSALNPESQQRRTALIIAQVLEGFHYTQPTIDDSLSTVAFDRFLESLDPNRVFFTQQDLRDFERYRKEFDDNLLNGHLDPPFDIFREFRRKVERRVVFAKRLLDNNDFDFTRDESYTFDREDVDWEPDEKSLDELWRKRVKNDVLTSRLSEDGLKKDDLHKRYDGITRRVQQMNAGDVFQAFINAFTLSIEPHTSYMSPRLSENFDIGMRLSLQGIGAVLRGEHEYTEVMSTVAGGPADKSGKLHSGDRIVGVAQGEDGRMEDVIGWRLQDVVDLIRGPKGSVVRLNVLPKNEGVSGRARELLLVRDEIKLEDKAAKSEVLELPELGGLKIGVIDIPAFYRDFGAQAAGERNFRSTTRDVRKLLSDLQQKEVDGIVIDLRQNGGGSLAEATELTGLFIEEGPVVQVRDSSGNVEVERDNDPELVYQGPLAVLVDRNSASASEIFAGAIQDYGRGLILGEPTFGKGTVQTLVNLSRYLKSDKDLGRLRLTMAQFFRVQGASTQHRGVMPDLLFPTAKGAAEHGERGLDHAIPWASIEPAISTRTAGYSVANLRDKTAQRIASDPGFAFLLEQENELIEVRETKTVSLNEAVRRAEREQREQRQLASRNRLREYRGLPPLKSLEEEDDTLADQDDDPEGINRIMLDESARVLADFIQAQRPLTAQVDR